MASSVFFKFKSQKEPTRVEFDGTGISVFELKREIILRSGLGDGTDFDLLIFADEDMKEVFDDDTTIIPRSTTVIARRLPPKIAGRGGAARYVSGKAPVHAKNASRREQHKVATASVMDGMSEMLNENMTEEEKLKALLNAQANKWSNISQTLSRQAFVSRSGPGAKRPVNVPDHPPPQGYTCHRCNEKGHWIQACPKNDDPDFDNRPRLKKTTGIPRSLITTIDEDTAKARIAEGGDLTGLMQDASGKVVLVKADTAAWEKFQAKAKVDVSAQTPSEDTKAVQALGLECAIDKKLFIDPMKTPCCERTYCNDCITNALIESDFVCPGCSSEGVLLDDLKPDDAAAEKIKDYLAAKEKKAEQVKKSSESPTPASASPARINGSATDAKNNGPKAKSNPNSPSPQRALPAAPPTGAVGTMANAGPAGNGTQPATAKKRPAEETTENPRIPKAPKAMQQAQGQQQRGLMDMMNGGMMQGMNGMGNMNGMVGFGSMGMMNGYGVGMGMMNPMVNPMMNPMMQGMSGFPNMGMADMMGVNGGYNNGMALDAGATMWGGKANHASGGGMGMPMNMVAPPGQQGQDTPFRNFSHQPAGDDDAYMRKPVNPHRHQNRQRRMRPSDYREL
ncbi:hypothetical protein P8C59_002950 [Phyllachora maydis]|uniref:Retinoblastoma-binding protein n=1 Tax=Phyllachora maydis TaxID=1825666 RepID=A0AAD9I0S7_9PEZI|nr:hypothetical protein P8C59_002950 [Phyllachora maydis]